MHTVLALSLHQKKKKTKSVVSSPLYLTVSFRCLEVDMSSQTARQKKLFKYLANQKDHARTKPSAVAIKLQLCG
jgi:hypothetical protein